MPTEPVLNLDKIYVILSTITLFAAIFSPMLTAIISNQYQLKLKKLELEDAARKDDENHKREIIEQYLIHAGRCLKEPYAENFSAYAGYHAIAFQYVPKELHGKMQKLHDDILGKDENIAVATFSELAIDLRAKIDNVQNTKSD